MSSRKKKEILFYAQYEVTRMNKAMFPPWVKVGQKFAVEVAYHTSPGGAKQRVTTIKYEVTIVDEAMFEVSPESRWAEHTILPIDDAPWVKLGQKVAIEVAHHHGPGGDLKRVTTIKPIERDASNEFI